MSLDAAQLRTLSMLLDEALELPDTEREPWLEQLGDRHRELTPLLREMLARQVNVATADVFATLPRIDSPDGDGRKATSAYARDAIVGPYRLVRELGRGGMGEVWLAARVDGLVARPVAIKLPTMLGSRHALAERFARERQILAPLEHPNIARLYDAGFAGDGQPYLALEYVEGEPIDVYCDAHRIDLRGRIALFLQALGAVQYAHTNLVLHRDLKPSNILVTAGGEVKLLDFGIAKLMDDGSAQETALTQMAGRALTLDYASPEQIAGAPLTTASDVYSLGVVLYELLCGERPYRLKRGTRGELEESIAAVDPRPPSRVSVSTVSAGARNSTARRIRRQLTGDIDTIALKTLRKVPQQRYATASALADDLGRYLAAQPILARPDSRWYRSSRFVRRNAVAVGVGAGVGIALLAFSIGSWTLLQRAERAADIAQKQTAVATAVQTFMTELFRTNTSDQRAAKQARDLTATELLDRGADKIETTLADAPAARASLLQLFGEMYEDLGLIPKSLAMHEKSVAAAAQVYGEDSREYALALLEKGWVANLVDRTSDAPLKMIEKAKAILARRAPGSEDYAEALYMESHFFQNNDAARAVAAGEESVRIFERAGAINKRSAFAKQELGGAYRAQGNLDAAAVTLASAISEFERLYGTDHTDVGTLHASLATVLQLQLRLAESEDQYRRAIAILSAFPAKRDAAAALNRVQLANVLVAQGRFDEAYAEYATALTSREAAKDTFAFSAAQVRVSRGGARITQGDAERGLQEIDAAYSERASFFPRSLVPPATVEEFSARGYLLIEDIARARAATDRAKGFAREQGVPAARGIAIALRDAEVTAREGRIPAALEIVDGLERDYTVGVKARESQMQIALVRARIHALTGDRDAVVTTLAPWIDGSLGQGVELPKAIHGEMLMLAGEALIGTSPADARKRLGEADAMLRAVDVAASPRRARVQAALARAAA